jgi:hypothetical protein
MDQHGDTSSGFKAKWGNRFIIAAIIQGGIITGMALATVAFQLLTRGVDIIQFLSIFDTNCCYSDNCCIL